MTDKRIVYKVENGMDRQDILCTTYQMRNFYRQLGDGFFTTLDIMNYIQHQQIVKWCKSGNHILDVCCGRGLLLPLLRYHQKDIGSYTGIDIEPKNATFINKRVTDGKVIENANEYYPFPVKFVNANVANMSEHVSQTFDLIVYTSSIEHMHKDLGLQSLHECRAVAKRGTKLILTCPNTPEDQDGYDTQYRAHVYEWKRSELLDGFERANFRLITEWGLLIDKKILFDLGEQYGFKKLLDRISQFVPIEWYIPIFATYFPKYSKEIGFIVEAV